MVTGLNMSETPSDDWRVRRIRHLFVYMLIFPAPILNIHSSTLTLPPVTYSLQ